MFISKQLQKSQWIVAVFILFTFILISCTDGPPIQPGDNEEDPSITREDDHHRGRHTARIGRRRDTPPTYPPPPATHNDQQQPPIVATLSPDALSVSPVVGESTLTIRCLNLTEEPVTFTAVSYPRDRNVICATNLKNKRPCVCEVQKSEGSVVEAVLFANNSPNFCTEAVRKIQQNLPVGVAYGEDLVFSNHYTDCQ